MEIVAYENGEDALIAWHPEKPIQKCLGFALMRRRNGHEEIVKDWVGFAGDKAQKGERRSSTNNQTDWLMPTNTRCYIELVRIGKLSRGGDRADPVNSL